MKNKRTALTPIEKAAIGYFNLKATGSDFRNRLLGPELESYSVYHHFGLGHVPDIRFVDDGSKLKKLYELENAQSLYLVSLLEGKVNENSRLLDLGSGSGGTAFDMNEKYGCFIDGINIADEQVKLTNKIAKARAVQDRVRFHNMNMRAMDFKPDTFNAAFSNETTMYINIRELYKELARVIMPEGFYAMVSWGKSDNHHVRNPYADSIDNHYTTHMNSLKNYLKALESEGFMILRFEDLTRLALDYWKLRKKSSIASGVEEPFIKGYEKGYLQYFSIVSRLG